MSILTEKVAYLKGLSAGLNLDADNKESKLFAQIIEVLDEVALSVEEIEARQDEMSEVIDDIDEDLADLEDEVYEECDCDDCDCDCDEDDFVEVECPHCGETVYFDSEMLEEPELVCPNCNELIYEDDEDSED